MHSLAALVFIGLAAAAPHASNPYSGYIQARHTTNPDDSKAASLDVDLGYSVYRGYVNGSTDMRVYKG
jgi:hypothetical protein